MRVVFQLQKYVSDSAHAPAEYPAAVFLSRDTWLVSDGHGAAYLISIPDSTSPAQVLASWELREDNTTVPSPFQLHNAAIVAPHLAIAVLSSHAPPTTEPSSSKVKEQPVFDIWAVQIPLSVASASSYIPFEVVWRRRGTYIPLFVKYIPVHDAFLLIGGSSYYDIGTQPVHYYEPAPDELASIPRAGDSIGTPNAPPPPYSWTQTEDTVTIAFALPGTTPKTSVHAKFEKDLLSLSAGSPPLQQPLYTGAPLWDAVHPSTSLWTWERGTATSAGLLTVHLDKAHPGTRWSHVFAQGFEAQEVAETLDPSELASIRESLDKYTASLREGGNDDLGHGIPSLAEGERDNEVDSNVGHSVVVTWVGKDGSACGPADDSLAVVLSLPLPGTGNDVPVSIVVKNDIDGPVYTLLDDPGAFAWKHTATFPALGFVLASKRDTRFTFHVLSSAAVLAFDSGARNNGGGNVYIYRGCAPGDKWANQGVFQQQTDAGALLGVGVVTSKQGQRALLCLSERELTVCRGLL